MPALYNEIDAHAAQWIRNLVGAGLVAPGEVEERSVRDLRASDVGGATQFHAFAGIAVWSRALRLAGWPDDVPVWTGSCPCQPFSAAGRRGGVADERHLWPDWFRLIAECRPAVVFGEQVASKDGLAWLDAVLADLEGAGYTCAAFDLCAAGVGAPHIRQRLFFVAYREEVRRGSWRQRLAHRRPAFELDGHGDARVGLGDSGGEGLEVERVEHARREREAAERGRATRAFTVNGFWSAAEWVACTDGKSRPVEPGTFPLAHGVAGRVGKLRAYGNAIVAPLAAEFIEAVMAYLVAA